MDRPFRTPLVPVFPIIGILMCVYLMTDLPVDTWIRFVVWLVVGMLIYVFYGYKHSKLRTRDKSSV
jgi:basic amino acid/polyamine antiporter, APA family